MLLAVIASMYAVYHGPDGLATIARRVHRLTTILHDGLTRLGVDVGNKVTNFGESRIKHAVKYDLPSVRSIAHRHDPGLLDHHDHRALPSGRLRTHPARRD